MGQIVVAAYKPWRPATEDRIAVFGLLGDPKDPNTSLDSGWGICQKPMLGPLFFSRFVEVTPITEGERTTLLYRTRFFGHKFDLSGLLHSGFLPGDTCVVRTA